MMSTAIMHQSALYDFGDLFLKVSPEFEVDVAGLTSVSCRDELNTVSYTKQPGLADKV